MNEKELRKILNGKEDKEKTNKRKELIENILLWVVIFFGILCILACIRMGFLDYSYDDICKNKYGENYIYEYDADFGRYCIELNYVNLTKENPKPFNWTMKEMKEICNTPKFFELSRWNKGIC